MKDVQNIYLCQVSETVSCGACCGLYNLPDLSEEKLEKLLSQRTRDFASVARTEDELYAFQRNHKGSDRNSRPFPHFHHCPFLGLVGKKQKRVGCLLHPASAGNKMVDYRSQSWYGERACRTYFCSSTRNLDVMHKAILTEIIDDWYLFGLIITEHELLNAIFTEIETSFGRSITVDDIEENRLRSALSKLLEIKVYWPYRRQESPGPCNYFFENGQYVRLEVFREYSPFQPSRYEKLFKELDSGFTSEQEVSQAEKLLDGLFQGVVDALE